VQRGRWNGAAKQREAMVHLAALVVTQIPGVDADVTVWRFQRPGTRFNAGRLGSMKNGGGASVESGPSSCLYEAGSASLMDKKKVLPFFSPRGE